MIGFGGIGLAVLILIGVTWLATRLIFPPGRESSGHPADRLPPEGTGQPGQAPGHFAPPGTQPPAGPAQPWASYGAGLQHRQPLYPGAMPPPYPGTLPPVFDPEAFLRDAKILFARMQAAYDRRDLSDIQQFTTPEVFAEISRQCQARGDGFSRTDIVALQAELLELKDERGTCHVSIRFSGMIHEDSALLAHPFAEIWRLVRPANGQTHWRIAAVEQQPAN